MTRFVFMWDIAGYGKRHTRIMACNADYSRKLAACARLWKRMDERLNGRRNNTHRYEPCFPLSGLAHVHRKIG